MKALLLTSPQKSLAVKLHNDGKTLRQIAEIVRNRSSVVEAYLKSRDGYPDKIAPRRPELQKPPGSPRTTAARTVRKDAGGSEDGESRAAEKQVESRKPVTLPPMPWDGEKANANEANRQ